MINLVKLQSEVLKWREKNFPESGVDDQFLGLVEELGELAHTRLKIRQSIRGANTAEEQDAIGDIMIYLLNYCSERGYILEEIISETWLTVSKRDWIKFPKNGLTE